MGVALLSMHKMLDTKASVIIVLGCSFPFATYCFHAVMHLYTRKGTSVVEQSFNMQHVHIHPMVFDLHIMKQKKKERKDGRKRTEIRNLYACQSQLLYGVAEQMDRVLGNRWITCWTLCNFPGVLQDFHAGHAYEVVKNRPGYILLQTLCTAP